MTINIDAQSPLAEPAAWFARSLRASRRSAATIDVYLGAVDQLDRFLGMNGMPRDLPKIKRAHVEAFMEDQDRRLRPASAATRYAGLRAFFRWALEEGEVKASPMGAMRSPKVPEVPVKVLSEIEVTALLKACDGTTFRQRRDMAIIRFMLDTGCRRSEVGGINMDDVDLDKQRVVVTGKGSKTRQVIYSSATAQAIDRYLRLRARHPYQNDPRMWLGQFGALTGDAVGDVVTRRSIKAGVLDTDGTPLHAHQLRHTWAHNGKVAGLTEENLMTLGGWESSTMLHRYGKAQASERALDAARRMFGDPA